MVEINNGATFQCYFSKAESFDGISPKSGSFNGMHPIFPKMIDDSFETPGYKKSTQEYYLSYLSFAPTK